MAVSDDNDAKVLALCSQRRHVAGTSISTPKINSVPHPAGTLNWLNKPYPLQYRVRRPSSATYSHRNKSGSLAMLTAMRREAGGNPRHF
jgi:hypothetical protein